MSPNPILIIQAPTVFVLWGFAGRGGTALLIIRVACSSRLAPQNQRGGQSRGQPQPRPRSASARPYPYPKP